MLILLPPSEGKAEPSRARPVDLGALCHADVLGPLRERLIAAVDPRLLAAPAARAAQVYTGVLYGQLDLASLPDPARRRANRQVLIASGLWGLLRPTDRIPGYKLPIGEPVPGIGRLAAAWRPLVAEALASADSARQLVVDCRSGAYSTVWRPARATHVEVNAFRLAADGTRQPISHMAKAARGQVARAALLAPTTPRSPEALLAAATTAGLDAELEPPTRAAARRWSLNVLEHTQ
jgi:cytoplasmic iron level regulating protein YaaA (DUF328/UPF0246 family)